MYYCIYESPLGNIAITANDKGLTALAFQEGDAAIAVNQLTLMPHEKLSTHEILKKTCQQLTQYFNHQRTEFDVPLAATGTPFRQQVWQALVEIPYGETESYAGLAKKINNEKAVRAVGTANGANPIALIVPCHRVIGSNGKLTGYAGGLALKEKLLQHEGASFIINNPSSG